MFRVIFIYFIFYSLQVYGENNPTIYITPYGYEKYSNENNLQNQYINLNKEKTDTGENLKNVNLINKLYFDNKEILIGGLFTNALFFSDDSGRNLFLLVNLLIAQYLQEIII